MRSLFFVLSARRPAMILSGARGSLDFETTRWSDDPNTAREAGTEAVVPLTACVAWGPPGERQTEFMGAHKRGKWQPLAVGEVLAQLELVTELDGVKSWWAHNGGRFDWLFLLHRAAKLGYTAEGHVAAGRIVYCRLRRSGGPSLNLYDSQALVPAPLKYAAKDWGLKSQKLFDADDYSTCPSTWPKQRMIDGVTADALCVLELVEAVETQATEWGGELRATFSGTAFSCLKSRYELADMSEFRAVNRVARRAYTGGRVEVYVHRPLSTVYEYDVNSSYPWAMTQKIPFEPLGHLSEGALRRWRSISSVGLLKARVRVPEMSLPVLPWIHPTNGLFFPTGEWSAWFHPGELARAEDLGCRVTPLAGLAYRMGNFTSFVTELFELKRKSKGAVREFAKLSLNGSYGKLGQNPERERLLLFSDADECSAWCADLPPWKRRKLAPRSLSPVAVADPQVRWAKTTNYAAAGAVTSWGRVRLHEFLSLAGDGACYADTDSVHTTQRLPGRVLDGAALGMLKLEASASEARYYAPKLYSLKLLPPFPKDRDGKEQHALYRAKGFPVNAKDFAVAVGGEKVARTRMKLLKSQLKSGADPERLFEEKQWSGLSGKRCPVASRHGDTRAWTVDELERGAHLEAASPLAKTR